VVLYQNQSSLLDRLDLLITCQTSPLSAAWQKSRYD
jgi:hypothetical protein